MSNFHGNLSRLSLVIQEVGAGVALPGWASTIIRSRLGKTPGFISNAVDKTATPPPVWLLDVKEPDETISREFIHTMVRMKYFSVCLV